MTYNSKLKIVALALLFLTTILLVLAFICCIQFILRSNVRPSTIDLLPSVPTTRKEYITPLSQKVSSSGITSLTQEHEDEDITSFSQKALPSGITSLTQEHEDEDITSFSQKVSSSGITSLTQEHEDEDITSFSQKALPSGITSPTQEHEDEDITSFSQKALPSGITPTKSDKVDITSDLAIKDFQEHSNNTYNILPTKPLSKNHAELLKKVKSQTPMPSYISHNHDKLNLARQIEYIKSGLHIDDRTYRNALCNIITMAIIPEHKVTPYQGIKHKLTSYVVSETVFHPIFIKLVKELCKDKLKLKHNSDTITNSL
ncbi:hypothetical protein [Ehrlichia japonica]|uniref:Uncharacterized protein n=1 Tax=Ehrlichia japonica TaxID=391036 RepID=X5GDA4_9RICK|nr:hypothetical protein [Ehrlichia japonica]AHX05057.1 hypothetical protein EHF_0759 [Ehrlichia japonica]